MFWNTIPLFILTPFAGVIVDKFNRHKLLIFIQILFTLQAFLIAAFTLSGHLRILIIVLLGLFLNMIAAIDGVRIAKFNNLDQAAMFAREVLAADTIKS